LVAPLTRPPIENGGVLLQGGKIVALGSWPDLRQTAVAEMHDLGECALLPGLVNAHSHLDYTDMAGLLSRRANFHEWIKDILGLKAQWDLDNYRRSWTRGAQMLLLSGTTTVADIESAPELLPAVWETTPLRVVSFLEVTGVRSRQEPEAILRETVAKAIALPVGRCRVGLSPHAPYSTIPVLAQRCLSVAREKSWKMSVHVAESRDEFEMFAHARGPMYDWLKRNQRDMSDCGHGSPVQWLARFNALAEHLLAVHVNYLAEGDAALLAGHGVSVAHCPRSCAYFGHREFPYEKLVHAGVNLCLGTDSLASVAGGPEGNPSLDLLAEMRWLAGQKPDVSPEVIVRMATVNGARALGFGGVIGAIQEGAAADLIALPFAGGPEDVYDNIIQHRGPVLASMIAGQWVFGPAAGPAVNPGVPGAAADSNRTRNGMAHMPVD
jgi:cytosine/adenosine deaminase-related metal-dependent hydrolase